MSLSIAEDIERKHRPLHQEALEKNCQQNTFNKHIEDLKKHQEKDSTTVQRKQISERKILLPVNRKNSKSEMTYEKALEIVQRNVKRTSPGIKVRRRTVMPTQILPSLTKASYGVSKKELQEMAMAICRELNEMISQSENPEGTRLRLVPLEKKHLFPDLSSINYKDLPHTGDKKKHDKIKTNTFSFAVQAVRAVQYDGWLEFLPREKKIRVFLINSNIPSKWRGTEGLDFDYSCLIAQGVDKQVYRAYNIELPLQSQKRNGISTRQDTTQVAAVWMRLHSGNIERARDGLAAQKILMKKIKSSDIKINVPSLPVERSGIPTSRDFSFLQERYNGTLLDALKKKSLPSFLTLFLASETSDHRYPVQVKDMLKVLIDVTNTLALMHKFGLVHFDVKPNNILIKIDEDRTFHGYLTDFDDSSAIQINERGFLTPFSDCYNVVLIIVRIFLRISDFEEIEWRPKRFLERKKSISETALRGLTTADMETAVKSACDLVFDAMENQIEINKYFKNLSKKNLKSYQILISPLPISAFLKPDSKEKITDKLKIIEECSRELKNYSILQIRDKLKAIYDTIK